MVVRDLWTIRSGRARAAGWDTGKGVLVQADRREEKRRSRHEEESGERDGMEYNTRREHHVAGWDVGNILTMSM
jgi:hypothetical protein